MIHRSLSSATFYDEFQTRAPTDSSWLTVRIGHVGYFCLLDVGRQPLGEWFVWKVGTQDKSVQSGHVFEGVGKRCAAANIDPTASNGAGYGYMGTIEYGWQWHAT